MSSLCEGVAPFLHADVGLETPMVMVDSATASTVYRPPAAGDVIGEKYRLERRLGAGSQGSVWLAEHLALDARFAIKLVEHARANRAPCLRLEKDARAAARLAHPAVVRVFDLGYTRTGDAFIVMEFLEGENLGDRLAALGRMDPVDAVRTLLPIADALHTAHAHGVVHRDLKPENVFLARTGQSIQPKLLDFGIAKLRGPRHADKVITDVGALLGSPAYLSPEQAQCSDSIGRQADIWSFCVVLYECVTGKVPFESDDYSELFRCIEQEPPVSFREHGVDEDELWSMVRRGLAKSPDDRWANMQNLGHALAAWLRARGVQDDVSGVLLESKWLTKPRSELEPALDDSDRLSLVRRAITRSHSETEEALAPRESNPFGSLSGMRPLVAGITVGAAIVGSVVLLSGRRLDTRAATTDPVALARPESPAAPADTVDALPTPASAAPTVRVVKNGASPALDRDTEPARAQRNDTTLATVTPVPESAPAQRRPVPPGRQPKAARQTPRSANASSVEADLLNPY